MYQHSYTYTVSQHGDYIQHSIDVQSDTYDFFLCVLVMTDRCKIYAPSWSEFSWECFRSISRAYTCSFFKPSRRSQRLLAHPRIGIVERMSNSSNRVVCNNSRIHVTQSTEARGEEKKAGKDGVRTREWRMAS